MSLPDYLPGRFALSRGRPSDYFALEHFHYLPRRPATYADVWTVTYAPPGGARRLIAVGVLSFPSFRCRTRERVLGLRDLSHKQRLAFVNKHLRTISRVVVHPQFRSLGLASRLVRKLIKVCPTRYVEASAGMARIHPFFETAGMRRVDADTSKPNDNDAPPYLIFDKRKRPPRKR